MKRFYKTAAAAAADDGYAVQLDGRSIKTPAKASLVLPTQRLAEAVAEEWNAQGDQVDPHSMPLTTLANTTIDRVIPNFEEVAEIVAAYGGSDLLCYRASEDQPVLVEKQQRDWQPWLDWAMQTLDAPLNTTGGILHVEQSAQSLSALSKRVAQCSYHELTALHEFTAISGSLVLGLAVLNRALEAEEAHRISRLEEAHQEELWGQGEEAAAKAAKRCEEMQNAERFLILLTG